MKVTVIGSAGTHATAQRVCSSYLLTHEGTNLVLDLGPGALHNLSKVIDVAELDGIIISHLHPDHYLDLYGLSYALRFHPDQARRDQPRAIPVYGPADLVQTVGAILPEDSEERFAEVLSLTEVGDGDRLRVGPFEVRLMAMNHSAPCLGSRVEANRKTVAYTGDTAPTPATTPLARDADLLICDCSWLESQRPLPADTHNTGREAGEAAAEAGVTRLLITHVSPTNDPAAVAAEAAMAFDGEIIVATDLMEITL
ncbi:MBL fold metallo-hydrolase [Euzebya tangerina]|uniref:MBL fold metallo-hydrolase n=1 Tax=Euzebya tangerina TaxID=591198 RepID=UPI0013C2AC8E|nr:MBL fold metallo-hydrolase [Euzebya tangerina]